MDEMRVYECFAKDAFEWDQLDPYRGDFFTVYSDAHLLIFAKSPAQARYRFSQLCEFEYATKMSIKVRKDIVIGPGAYHVAEDGWEVISAAEYEDRKRKDELAGWWPDMPQEGYRLG